GEGFEPPLELPAWGYAERTSPPEDLPRIGILYSRAHEVSGTSGLAHALAVAVDATGSAVAVPIFSSSLRSAPDDIYEALAGLDALVVTVLAAGGTTPSSASAGGDDESWDVDRLNALDIPI